MFSVIKVGNDIITREIREFIADKITDIDKLPRKNIRGTQDTKEKAFNDPIAVGSKCFVIESSETYMLGSDNEWHLTKTSIGGSGVNGKNCTIQSIVETEEGNVVTFEWTNDDGTIETATMTVENGVDGKDGSVGATGTAGVAAGFGTPTATIDSNVGTPSVTVTSSGSNTAKVFSFAFKNLKGEPGADGAKGDTGPQGSQGVQGVKGDAFTYVDFTEAQLSALKGEKGDQGIQGVKGDTGAKGDKGDTGATGSAGRDGTNGTNGKDGVDGKSITAIEFTTDATGVITGGTATLNDNSTLPITITIATT